jgi:hypothetical protein
MSTAITVGSIADLAAKSGVSLAESFISCDAIVIIDVSGSMGAHDSRGDKSRYDVALEELTALQQNLPGRCGVIAFSDEVHFIPGGVPPFLGSGTDLAAALRFARVADVPEMRFFVISDGEPNEEQAAMAVARGYNNRIDTIYVGPERDPRGRDFLARLAQATGGQSVTADRVMELAERIETLLLKGA